MAHRWRNRIRTIDPLLRKPLLGVADRTRLHERRSHLQVQVRDGDACLEWLPIAFPFTTGPRVRIRLPPAESRANHWFFPYSASATPRGPSLATNYRGSGLVVCPACSVAWG